MRCFFFSRLVFVCNACGIRTMFVKTSNQRNVMLRNMHEDQKNRFHLFRFFLYVYFVKKKKYADSSKMQFKEIICRKFKFHLIHLIAVNNFPHFLSCIRNTNVGFQNTKTIWNKLNSDSKMDENLYEISIIALKFSKCPVKYLTKCLIYSRTRKFCIFISMEFDKTIFKKSFQRSFSMEFN